MIQLSCAALLRRRTSCLWLLICSLIWKATLANTLADFIKLEEYVPESHSGPFGTVPHNGTFLYQPAPPGKSPRCARGGLTYCAEVPVYPSDVIRRLLTQWKYDLSSVFVSEKSETLTSTPSQTPSRRRGRRKYGRRSFSQSRDAAGRRRPISDQDDSEPAKSRRFGSNQSIAQLFAARRNEDDDEPGYSFTSQRRPRRQADDVTGGSQLCPTIGQFVMPKAGLNSRGEWRYVINVDDEDDDSQVYSQLVRTERCLSSRCSGLCTIPAGMEASCQQQYVQKKLVGLDPSGSQMYTDIYWLPHCCVCQIR
ncbi:protein spaetzle 5-like [Amphibalanus amphitrite]|uniref:protein spaetzle 5-like n=1 Tax=Amphibalanus amphitrite TaxID=1232801 RepID=UPI001C8FF21B|nr:protein spaetzle 5-like [Amphibalanus amphitrite]